MAKKKPQQGGAFIVGYLKIINWFARVISANFTFYYCLQRLVSARQLIESSTCQTQLGEWSCSSAQLLHASDPSSPESYLQ